MEERREPTTHGDPVSAGPERDQAETQQEQAGDELQRPSSETALDFSGDGAAPTVVGLGASAGGLAALKEFFDHVPEGSGLAFVVVVHLSPEHESHLAELLQPHVKMPALQVAQTTRLEPDHVYVIPPGANLSAIDTHLRLSDLEEKRLSRAPIDHFFRTLADSHDGHSVGVVLTGTGSDGTLGIREIKERGGLTIAQSPEEAEYDGMPQSAIASGMIDRVLPVAEIPPEILRFARTEPQVRVPADGADVDDGDRRVLQKIFAQVRTRTGRDFSNYKRSTIMRRVRRRMQMRFVEELDPYVQLLREDEDEARALADDFLITVTNFFRDREVFEHLEQEVIPQLFEDKGPDDDVRVWSVGCATGEEAYSLAILLLEACERRDEPPPQLQVFASDLHERSLAKARDGFYPGDIEADVAEARLRRFFTREDSGYRIGQEVRDLVVFAPHDLLGDPPFSKLDLVACRNVMIYLRRGVQEDVTNLFHYALRPGGYLLLGTSETTTSSDLFRLESKPCSLYRRRDVPAPEPYLPIYAPARGSLRLHTPQPQNAEGDGRMRYGRLHQRMVEQYGPPSMLLSPEFKVVHLSEHAGRYLVHPGGEITTSAFKLVREELRIELRASLHAALKKNEPVHSKAVSVPLDGEARHVALHVRPATKPQEEGFALVFFEEYDSEEKPHPGGPGGATEQELEAELLLTKERLKTIIDEYESGQEAMRASNEELQSSNEELRSTMEELETSKEELQSMNEELQTISQENRHKVEELAQLSSDLQNLLASTDIATLFLDREMRIMRFTPKVQQLFHVRAADRGRPLSHLRHGLAYDELTSDAEEVLRTLVPVEREVEDDQGRWHLTRLLPYRTADDRIEGVVITFIDITDRKEAEEAVREAKVYAENIVETLHEPLLVLTPDLRVKSANQAFYDNFQVREQETVGRMVYELGNEQWDIPELRELLEDVLPDSEVFTDYEVRHEFEELGERVMLLNARRLDHVQLVLLGIRDITKRKRDEEALREMKDTLEERVEERTQQVRKLASTLTIAEQEERRRISQLLHDDLQQRLYGIQLKLHLAQSDAVEGETEGLQAHLAEADAWIDESVELTRGLSVDLSPPILKSEGLVDTLGWLKAQMWELHELDVEVEAEHSFRTPQDDMRVLLFQIVRELLFNVAKHAGTDRATVSLRDVNNHVEVVVADKGKGFDAEEVRVRGEDDEGFGLFSVRERLGLFGGEMTIESVPGKGTRVIVSLPLKLA